MFDYGAFRALEPVTVPPTHRILDITLTSDQAEYRPGQQAEVDVLVKDSEGNPVETELSLAVADASVWAIQGDVAGDVRAAFWGRTRPLRIQTTASGEQFYLDTLAPSDSQPGEYERRRPLDAYPEEERYFADRLEQRGAAGRQVLMSREGGSVNGIMPASPPMMESAMALDAAQADFGFGGDAMKAKGEPMAEARVRSDFRSTALWLADLRTDADAAPPPISPCPTASPPGASPRSPPTARTRVRPVPRRNQKPTKPIMIRPQAPRFLYRTRSGPPSPP